MTLVTDNLPEKPPIILLPSSINVSSDEDTTQAMVKTEESLKVLPTEEVLLEMPSNDKSEETSEVTRRKFVIEVGDTKALKGWLVDYNRALLNLKIVQEAGVEIMTPFLTEHRKEQFSELLDEQTQLGQKVVEKVIKIFEMRTDKEIALNELTMLKQGDMSVSEYAERLRTLGEFAYDEEVPVDIREALLLNHFIENSNNRFRKELMKTETVPQSLDEMVMRMERFQIFEEYQSATDGKGRREAYYQLKAYDAEKQEPSDKLLTLTKWPGDSEWKTDYNRSYRNSYPIPTPIERRFVITLPTERRYTPTVGTTPFNVLANHRTVPGNRYNPNVRQGQRFGPPQRFGANCSNGNRFQRNQTVMPTARDHHSGNQFQRFQSKRLSNMYFQQNRKFHRNCNDSNGESKAASDNSHENQKPVRYFQGNRNTFRDLRLALFIMMMILIRPAVAVSSQRVNSTELLQVNTTGLVYSSALQVTESRYIDNSLQEIGNDTIMNLTSFYVGKIVQVIIGSVTNTYVCIDVIKAERLRQLQPDGIIECREAIRYKSYNGVDLIDVPPGIVQIVNNPETSDNHDNWLETSHWESPTLLVQTKIDYSRGFANASTLSKILKCSLPSGQWELEGCNIISDDFNFFQHQEIFRVNEFTDRYFVISETRIELTSWEDITDLENEIIGMTIDNVNGNVDGRIVSPTKLICEHLIPNINRRLKGQREVKSVSSELIPQIFFTLRWIYVSAINIKALKEFVKSIRNTRSHYHALDNTFRYRNKLIANPIIIYQLDTTRMNNNRIVARNKMSGPKDIHSCGQRLKKRIIVSGIRQVTNRMSNWLNKTFQTRKMTVSTSQLSHMPRNYLRSNLDFSFDPEIGKRRKLDIPSNIKCNIPRSEIIKFHDSPVSPTETDHLCQPLKTITNLTVTTSITIPIIYSSRPKEFSPMITSFTQITIAFNTFIRCSLAKSILQTTWFHQWRLIMIIFIMATRILFENDHRNGILFCMIGVVSNTKKSFADTYASSRLFCEVFIYLIFGCNNRNNRFCKEHSLNVFAMLTFTKVQRQPSPSSLRLRYEVWKKRKKKR